LKDHGISRSFTTRSCVRL